jgi:hypothetical protein
MAFWPTILGGETVTASWADAVTNSSGESNAKKKKFIKWFIGSFRDRAEKVDSAHTTPHKAPSDPACIGWRVKFISSFA